MHALWLDELETLEAISQHDDSRRLFLRMAQLSQDGRVTPFLHEVAADGDLDLATKSRLFELAQDSSFLNAVEDYLHRTGEKH